MKLIVAGSRGLLVFSDFIHGMVNLINHSEPNKVTEIVSGTAAGIDKSGEFYAEEYNLHCEKFPAPWKEIDHPEAVIRENQYGQYDANAGRRRNKQMADYADALLLIWDGKSDGSKNMLETMKKQKKPIYEVILRRHNVG